MYVFLPLRTMKPSPYEVRKTREINGFIRGQNIPRVKKKYTGNAETWRQAVDQHCRMPEIGDRSPQQSRTWSDENPPIRS